MLPSESNDIEVIVSDTMRQKFIEILKNNEILDEVDTITMKEPGALKGQNFGSSIVYVHIKFKNPEIKPKNLFVKNWQDNSSAHTEMLKNGNVMGKETEFLRDFVSFGKEFCKKYPGCEKFLDCFPKCFYGDCDMVVLENLVLDDTFVMLPKENFQDLDAAKFVLTSLARFHATTYVILEEIGLEKFSNKFKLTAKDLYFAGAGALSQLMIQMVNNTVATTTALLQGNPVEGVEYAVEKLNMYNGKGQQLVEEYCKNDRKLLSVIHGELWNNNMLFKINPETGKVYDLLFVDLQITRLGSPSQDLSFYLYLSVKSEVIRMHLKELLLLYYNEFKQVVEKGFGKKCNFTFEEFIQDFKRCSALNFFMSLGGVSAMKSMKYIDVKKMGSSDLAEITTLFKEAIEKWIQESPHESKELAKEIVQNINFYFQKFP